uniref:Replication protein A OB domain-containing protein n=1 Tax=Solanum tuberosum TaxID=4113 RepID=M1CIH2_SOLTU
MYGSDIKSYAELFLPYHTYLISVASVTESNHAYGIPINTFLWTIDKGTLIEPIEEVEPPEDSLPPPTRLTVTMFDSFHHQPEGLEFDVLAIVVNVALPTCAANGSRIQELIIMDNQKKPKKLTLWESFIDHVGIYIAEQLNQYPIILARKIAKSKSYAGLTSRFATTIQINPPYPQVAALRKWATSNEQLLIAYTKKSITSTGSLQLIPFEDEIISIADAHQHLPPVQHANKSLLGFVHRGDSIVQLVAVPQILFQALNHPLIYSYNKCQFDITITDNSGSATALISDEAAETMLHLTSEEIYDIRCTKKQMLPLANVTRQLSGKTFTIQVKNSFAKTMDGTPANLIILLYVEKENIISAPSSPAPMNTAASSKRKIGKDKEEATSHRRHAPSPKLPLQNTITSVHGCMSIPTALSTLIGSQIIKAIITIISIIPLCFLNPLPSIS